MLTGELRSPIDAIWNSFWSGGISNPLELMEQITYLLFLRRLDALRWSRLKNFAPAEMYKVVGWHVSPFLRTMGGDGATYAQRMKDARFSLQSGC